MSRHCIQQAARYPQSGQACCCAYQSRPTGTVVQAPVCPSMQQCCIRSAPRVTASRLSCDMPHKHQASNNVCAHNQTGIQAGRHCVNTQVLACHASASAHTSNVCTTVPLRSALLPPYVAGPHYTAKRRQSHRAAPANQPTASQQYRIGCTTLT
jgi:hypothetical protein